MLAFWGSLSNDMLGARLELERGALPLKINKMAMRTLPLPGNKITLEREIGSDNVLVIMKS
jgi:hypothetical protein